MNDLMFNVSCHYNNTLLANAYENNNNNNSQKYWKVNDNVT